MLQENADKMPKQATTKDPAARGKLVFAALALLGLGACMESPPADTSDEANARVDPAMCPEAPKPNGHPWEYDGPEGQDHWGTTDGYPNCTNGRSQSPIDIENPVTRDTTQSGLAGRAYGDAPGRFYDNGHTLMFLFPHEQPGGTLELDGVTYTLDQFHFHAPSEHRIGGKAHPMEAHFVHSAPPASPGGPPRRAVVAVMIDVGPEENTFLAPLFAHLPEMEGGGTCLQTEGLADVLLGDRGGFYRYDGSLTTPDCSEHVQWIIMEKPILASAEQIGEFVSVFPDNARHVQPLDGRTITFYPGGPAAL
ncbi:carbonic anhydrase family protein [Polyangium sp. y55x31]|uniref:carbonic anhydrase n=1 Tax=Polyangium sp. y55x31 TaxID=3042688 RepID=UPI0024821C96|nr:carbonic anhydrase family protein [Polyangium sp. y55x31]MDI1478931.1 carbonic anhydrase family protein [Polyangium sp. y55x31]